MFIVVRTIFVNTFWPNVCYSSSFGHKVDFIPAWSSSSTILSHRAVFLPSSPIGHKEVLFISSPLGHYGQLFFIPAVVQDCLLHPPLTGAQSLNSRFHPYWIMIWYSYCLPWPKVVLILLGTHPSWFSLVVLCIVSMIRYVSSIHWSDTRYLSRYVSYHLLNINIAETVIKFKSHMFHANI